MIKQKKFLLFTIIIGLACIAVGSITLFSILENLLKP